MRIEPVNNSINFKGLYNNKALLFGLEKISDHPASFVALTTFVASSFVRPFVISKTPNTDDETKKYLMAESVTSGIAKFITAEAIAMPIEGAIKKIDKNPDKFLNKETISILNKTGSDLLQSKNYKSLAQMTKLSANFISAIPKSFIGVALIPFAMDFLFKKSKDKNKTEKINKYDPVFSPVSNSIAFKGKKEILPELIGKIYNKKPVLNFVNKIAKDSDNIARNISIATDMLLMGAFCLQTKNNKKIKEDKKPPLIYNKLISGALSLFMGYGIDKAVQKGTKNCVDKIASHNKDNKKCIKYIEGINILRPTLIFAGIYYGILPFFSAIMANKADKFQKQKSNQNYP